MNQQQPLSGLSISVMRAVLTKWGAICEASRNWSGYPTSDTTHRAAHSTGGGGKRLPIPNVPSFAIQISAEVMKLPDEEGNAVTLWYAHHFNAEGAWLTPEQKAQLLGITPHTLRYLERRGRETLLRQAPQIIDTWQAWQDEKREAAELQLAEAQ